MRRKVLDDAFHVPHAPLVQPPRAQPMDGTPKRRGWSYGRISGRWDRSSDQKSEIGMRERNAFVD
jgi:hypothetical protein